ncbi:MAG: DUF4295 domain-containing protein [Bacteroidetes bacterium]|jgi:hypothetical protein|nr:DUF4295 domain-containing protein [Bacteroidota bacterium]NBP05861.1 DUF4295 domain-containing protein [Bacteroidota bacterium]
MAKKVVATLKKEGAGNDYVKVIKAVKSPKSGHYTFREEIVPQDAVKDFFSKP